jgi:NADH-quinone oxidoreductase subunit H
MVLLVIIIVVGSLSLQDITTAQLGGLQNWFIFRYFPLNVIAFLVFFTAGMAECNRAPFDIPEAESELVADITTEYTGMKFGLFYMTEYVHTLVASGIAAALFLGGWDGPFAPGFHWFMAKTLFLFFIVYWIRWTLMRFRSDQLLRLCWRWLVPLSVLLVGASGVWVVLSGAPGVKG